MTTPTLARRIPYFSNARMAMQARVATRRAGTDWQASVCGDVSR